MQILNITPLLLVKTSAFVGIGWLALRADARRAEKRLNAEMEEIYKDEDPSEKDGFVR